MQEADALVTWLERIGSVGFGTLLGLILFGNFMGIWLWGKTHRERMAEHEAREAKLEAEKNEWKEMALGLLTPLERTVRGPNSKRV